MHRNKTTCLTVSRRTFEKIMDVDPGIPVKIEFCNDVVSSARGEKEDRHHTLRRYDLLSRQFGAEFYKVKVRYVPDATVEMQMVTPPRGNSDECSCFITVVKPSMDMKKKTTKQKER